MPQLPNPVSTLPGATWRPLTLDDVAAYVRLHEDARVADTGTEVTTEDVARHELTDPNCPLATNTVALELPDRSLAASMQVMVRLHGIDSRRVFLSGTTHPAHRGRGIGSAILGWALARADEILADEPADLIRVVEAFEEVRLADAVALHEAAGFRPVRWYFVMRRDLRQPLPAMPDLGGLRLESYAPALAERVRLAHNEAFADHWGSEPLTPDLWGREFVGDPFFRGDLSFVVLDGDEIAGYTVNYVIEPDWEATGVREGWVGQLGVRRPWRKRGLGTALLVRSMEAFRAAGLEAATLAVDAENPTGALGVYERVSFRPIRRSVRLQRPHGV
ncbi:MAG TPA: GNAT family N-acetyltransferase [Patescibacteria group bacterium]|nr:GNAT family N-acetyltransferase [Patescibacteria group bacterium]